MACLYFNSIIVIITSQKVLEVNLTEFHITISGKTATVSWRKMVVNSIYQKQIWVIGFGNVIIYDVHKEGLTSSLNFTFKWIVFVLNSGYNDSNKKAATIRRGSFWGSAVTTCGHRRYQFTFKTLHYKKDLLLLPNNGE